MAESASTGAKAALTFCHTFLHEELTADHNGIEQQLEKAHSDWSELAAGREAAEQIEQAARSSFSSGSGFSRSGW